MRYFCHIEAPRPDFVAKHHLVTSAWRRDRATTDWRSGIEEGSPAFVDMLLPPANRIEHDEKGNPV